MHASVLKLLTVYLRCFLACVTLALCLGPRMLSGKEISVQDVSVATVDRQVPIRLFPSAEDGPHPAIVLLHGGSGYHAYPHLYASYATALAAHGYNVYAVMYYDEADEDTLRTLEPAGRQAWYARRLPRWINTVRETLGYIAQQPATDAHRLGLLGFSQGGSIAVGVAGLDHRIRALGVVYGWMPAAVRGTMERLPPTLILHGDADTAVGVKEAYALESFLKQRAIAYEMKIYVGGRHGFDANPISLYAQDARQRTLDFFDARLMRRVQ